MTESFSSQRRPHPETRSALCDPTPLQTAYWRYGVLLGTHKARLPWKLLELRPHSVEGFLGRVTLDGRGLSAPGPARETNLPPLSRSSLALTFTSVLNFLLQLQTPASNCLLSTSAQMSNRHLRRGTQNSSS